MPTEQRRIYSVDEARVKIRRYCAYQERSQREVKQKLMSYGLRASIADELLVELIQEDFLNEQRFALALARGKANAKGWGPKKIEYTLRQKGVSLPNIKKALAEIDDDAVHANLERLAKKKWDSLQGLHPANRKQKTITFLVRKGYPYEDVASVLKLMRDA